MNTTVQFKELFKKYRLRSEIESLIDFGNLLANEGIFYEDSLFTKWQRGERVPKDRKTLLTILKIFITRGGITNLQDANIFFASSGLGYLTEDELKNLPVLNDTTPFLAPGQIPHFIDRSDIRTQIIKALLSSRSALIYGPPGIGKTTLAITIAHQLKLDFPDGVLWYQLNNSSAMDILLSIANLYGKDISTISDIEIRASIVRSITSNKKILFIYDSAEDGSELEYLLPSSPTGSILITSLSPWVSSELIDKRIHLTSFTFAETKTLFQKINGNHFTDTNSEMIQQLFKKVEGHPLALSVIAKQLFYSKKIFSTFIKSFDRNQTNLKNFSYQNKNLEIVLSTTIDKLTPEEKKVLISASVFHGKDFSIAAISYINNLSYEKTLSILEKLERFSLIEYSQKITFRIHPLIRLFLASKAESSIYIKASLFYIEQLQIRRIKHNFYLFINSEFENIIFLFEYCLRHKQWNIACLFGEYLFDYLWHTRHWTELERYSKKILSVKNNHKNIKTVAFSLMKLSNLYYWQGKKALAEKYSREGLKIAHVYKDQAFLYGTKEFLGRILIGKNKILSAKKELQEAINFFRKKNDIEHLANCYKYLGEIALRESNLKQAAELFSQSHTYYNSSVITASRLVNQAITLIYLGEVYLLKNEKARAEKLFKQGIQLCKKSNETWGITTFGYLGLGVLYEQTGMKEKALKNYKLLQKGIHITGFKEYLITQNSFYFALRRHIECSNLFRPLFK